MSESPWIRFFPSDWLAGTRGLSAAETGIYITLVMMMYERGAPIANEPTRLARLCGTTPGKFRTVLSALIEAGKIEVEDGGLWNRRVQLECDSRSEKRWQASASAKKRWQKEKENQQPADANAMRRQSERNANHNQKPEEIEPREQLPEPRALAFDKLIEAASCRGPCHPNLAMGFLPIADLIAEGYDLEADILPVIRDKASSSISSWRYFVAAIRQRKQERSAAPPIPQPAAIDWAGRVRVFAADGTWAQAWGPKPGENGCKVPVEFLSRAA